MWDRKRRLFQEEIYMSYTIEALQYDLKGEETLIIAVAGGWDIYEE